MAVFYLYNYVKKVWETLLSPPEDWPDYIPQDSVAQGLYVSKVALGMIPAEAAAIVFELYLRQEIK